jgi:hypothetical protein
VGGRSTPLAGRRNEVPDALQYPEWVGRFQLLEHDQGEKMTQNMIGKGLSIFLWFSCSTVIRWPSAREISGGRHESGLPATSPSSESKRSRPFWSAGDKNSACARKQKTVMPRNDLPPNAQPYTPDRPRRVIQPGVDRAHLHGVGEHAIVWRCPQKHTARPPAAIEETETESGATFAAESTQNTCPSGQESRAG